MRVIDELLRESPKANMVPSFILSQVTRLAAQQDETIPKTSEDGIKIIRRALIEAIGLERIPSAAGTRLVDRIVDRDCIIEKLVYEAVPGLPVPALLYLPPYPGPHPAVVHPPGHWMEDGKLERDIQVFNLSLARNGIATLCYDTLGQGERRIGWHQHGQLAPLLVGFTSLGVMVRESMAGLSILDAREDIDSSRLGLVGASGGGFSSIFAAAIDERVSAAAIGCIVNTHLSQIRDAAFGTGWDSWVDLCNQVPGLCAVGTMDQILACVAPRHLLVANAQNDPGFPIEGARDVAAKLVRILHARGVADSFSYREVPGGHGLQPRMREALADFLVARLGGQGQHPEREELPFSPQWEVPHHCATAEHPQSTRPIPSSGTCLLKPVDSNLPLVNAARERARALRRSRHPLSSSSLGAAIGPFPDRSPLNARVTNHIPLPTGPAQRLEVQVEPGIDLDALFLLPDSWSDDLPPVLMVLDEGGKAQALTSAVVEHARRRECAVLLPDLRGTGESAASEFEVSTAAWMLDRDLLNQRVWDVLRLVDFLSERYSSAQQIDKGRIFVWGSNSFALIALLAAALDKRIAGACAEGPDSLEELLTLNSNVTPMVYHYRLLEVLDLHELKKFAVPRPVHLGVAEKNLQTTLDSLLG